MGRIGLSFVLALGVSLSVCGMASAWPGKDDKEKKQDAAPGASAAADRAARDKAMREWQSKLGNSRWELEVVVSSGGPATVVQSDVLKFQHGSMQSETLAKAGYEPTSFALYPPTATSVEWEAMQRKTKDGAEETAIWRGEVTGERIRGTLTQRIVRGDKEDTKLFSFTGKPMAPEPEPVPAPVVESAPPVAPQAAPAPAADSQPATPVPAPEAAIQAAPAAEPIAPAAAPKHKRSTTIP